MVERWINPFMFPDQTRKRTEFDKEKYSSS